jgi:hypothetical protein
MAEDLYLTWGDDSERAEAYQASTDNIEAYDGVQKASADYRRTFIDIEPNRSVRPSFTRRDYDAFRLSDSVPSRQKRIIKMCMDAYDRVGIIRNVIDLMADFSSQGITIVHPNKTIEQFYRKWFKSVSGTDRSERFLNYLYRTGNVVTRRRTAKINNKKEKELRRAAGTDMVIEEVKIRKREIPWQYDFLNPLAVDIRNKATGMFTGRYDLVLNLSNNTFQNLTKDKKNLAVLPADIRKRLEKGDKFVELDPEKVDLFHYKKDDWLFWANPMIYAILDDVMMLEKMKLADMAALDGAISNIRLWTVGDLEHKILPKKAVITKLRDILASNVGGGTMDLVWGPELDFKESNSQVYRFLGSEKYQPVLTSIYAGLGIPPTLTGAATSGGYSNNYVSLKTLIERLEYGRDTLRKFWEQEIKIVQKAMGFRIPAQLHFDSIILSDEAAQKQLLVQLADRDIISHETLLERFREIPGIEKIRVRREERQRVTDVLSPDKAGPFHNPQHKQDVAKIALTKDIMDSETYLDNLGLPPAEVQEGLPEEGPDNIPPRENKTRIDERDQVEQLQGRKPTPERPDGGRPKFSRDTQKRKQKRVVPKSNDRVSAALWASKAQKTISDLMAPMALSHFGKKNIRSLNKAEFDQLEHLKLCILTGLQPYMEINESVIKSVLDNKTRPSEVFTEYVENSVASFVDNNNRKPNVEELRQIYSFAFSEIVSF